MVAILCRGRLVKGINRVILRFDRNTLCIELWELKLPIGNSMHFDKYETVLSITLDM